MVATSRFIEAVVKSRMLRAKYNICTIVDALDFSKLRVGLGVMAALCYGLRLILPRWPFRIVGMRWASKGFAGGTAFEVDHLALPSTGAGGSFMGTSAGSKPLAGLVCHNCGDREKDLFVGAGERSVKLDRDRRGFRGTAHRGPYHPGARPV